MPNNSVMRTYRSQLRATVFVLFFVSLLIFPPNLASSQSDPFLNQFSGSWRGDGKSLGMTARLHLNWEWVLGNKFLRLNLKSTMQTPNGEARVFEGHAYYQSLGKSKYEGKWFDSRGVSFPIKAEAVGDTLIGLWGTPETEEGKSTYRIIEPGKMEVLDSVKQKDGSWKEFGRWVVVRE